MSLKSFKHVKNTNQRDAVKRLLHAINTPARSRFRAAWRECRLLNWGTLHFTFPTAVSAACRQAYDARRHSVAPLRLRLHLRKSGRLCQLPAPGVPIC